MICIACGAALKEEEHFCSGCRTPVATTPVAENYQVVITKKEIRIILLGSAIGALLGALLGAINATYHPVAAALGGMWLGIGIGGGIDSILGLPGLFMCILRKYDFIDAMKITVAGSVARLIIYIFAGPIGLLVRIIERKILIKECQKNN